MSCFSYEEVVFDSDSEFAGDVDAWLDGENLAGEEFFVVLLI